MSFCRTVGARVSGSEDIRRSAAHRLVSQVADVRRRLDYPAAQAGGNGGQRLDGNDLPRVVFVADGPATAGGIFAQPSNIGAFTQQQFAVLMEFGARVEYAYTPQLRLTLGYNYLYWSRVARASDSLNTTVDTAGGTAPPFAFRNTDFWSHGLSAGVYYDF